MSGKEYSPPKLDSEPVFREALLGCNIRGYEDIYTCEVKGSPFQCEIETTIPEGCFSKPPNAGPS